MLMELITTTDIVLAATLKLKGKVLHHITKNGNKGTFHFENVTREEITEYDMGGVLVEPISLNNTIKQLTSAIKRM